MPTTKRQLEVLDAVGRARSLAGAGRELGIPRSDVAQAVARLERNERAELVEVRGAGRGSEVRLTPRGRGLLKRSRSLLEGSR